MARPTEALRLERHAQRSCCAEVRHARSSDTDKCPNAANDVPADDHRADTAGRTPDTATVHRLHGPDECEPLHRPTLTQRHQHSMGIESPESGHIVPCPAPAHYAPTHLNPRWAKKISCSSSRATKAPQPARPPIAPLILFPRRLCALATFPLISRTLVP